MFKSHQWMLNVALAGLIAAPAMAQQPADQPAKPNAEKEKVRVELRTPPRVTVIKPDAAAPSVSPSEFWLGIECYSVLPALRAQLTLPEGQGLVVASVAKDSPALKAGVARHDILLRAGDKPLANPEDLVGVIQGAKETKLKLELIRGGKPMAIEVAPARRPRNAEALIPRTPSDADRETVRKWLEGNGLSGDIQLHVFGPGVILRGIDANTPPLPNNLSIAITREGDQPAKITVKRNDEKWELTEKDLDKLPADIRPHVERMLHGGPFQMKGPRLKAEEISPNGGAIQVQPFPGPIDSRLERRFDEMNRRMERLFKMVEEMNEDRHAPQAPAPEEKPQEEK